MRKPFLSKQPKSKPPQPTQEEAGFDANLKSIDDALKQAEQSLAQIDTDLSKMKKFTEKLKTI